MTLETGKQIITIHMLHNISTGKGNQTVKFGQLIKYNMGNIFLKKHTQNMVEKLVLDRFLKIKIEHTSGSTV